MNSPRTSGLIVLLSLILGTPALAGPIYVDQGAGSDLNNGLTPGTAVATVTKGSTLVSAGDELIIGPGTYNASSGETFPVSFTDGISIMGAGPDLTVLDGEMNTAVISHDGSTATVVISNLAIVNGSAGTGGGVAINSAAKVSLSECRIEGNQAPIGGGIYLLNVAEVAIDRCTFFNNTGNIGGGFHIQINSDIDVVMDVTRTGFTENVAFIGSSIQFQENGSGSHILNIDQSIFSLNGASSVSFSNNSGTSIGNISNSLFVQNTGTAVEASLTSLQLVNSTFADNVTALSAGSGATIVNSIFWDNSNEITGSGGGSISHSIIQGLELGGQNNDGNLLDVDPLFNANYQLNIQSPAIDQGKDMAADDLGLDRDLDGEIRKNDFLQLNRPDGVIDLGADEVSYLFRNGYEAP